MIFAAAPGGGTFIRVQVQPRAARTEIAGPHGDAIRIRLAAPPVEGAANEALIRLLSSRLGVPRAAVSIRSGQGGRRKVVAVAGLGPGEAARRLGLPAS